MPFRSVKRLWQIYRHSETGIHSWNKASFFWILKQNKCLASQYKIFLSYLKDRQTISSKFQSFIQALLLTFVFHEGLSFIAVGHNSMCVSMLAIATGGSYKVLSASLVWSRGNASGSFGYFINLRFSNSLSMHHWVTYSFKFLGLFLAV